MTLTNDTIQLLKDGGRNVNTGIARACQEAAYAKVKVRELADTIRSVSGLSIGQAALCAAYTAAKAGAAVETILEAMEAKAAETAKKARDARAKAAERKGDKAMIDHMAGLVALTGGNADVDAARAKVESAKTALETAKAALKQAEHELELVTRAAFLVAVKPAADQLADATADEQAEKVA
jgi:hypothetical protein